MHMHPPTSHHTHTHTCKHTHARKHTHTELWTFHTHRALEIQSDQIILINRAESREVSIHREVSIQTLFREPAMKPSTTVTGRALHLPCPTVRSPRPSWLCAAWTAWGSCGDATADLRKQHKTAVISLFLGPQITTAIARTKHSHSIWLQNWD